MAGDLLEREAELAALERAASDARDGAGTLVLIEGPAGIGKSSLLARAGDGMLAVRARGSEVERDVAFGVARQLLERPVARLDPAGRARVLAGAAALAEPVVLGAASRPGAPDAATALRHGLFWAVANLADEAPLALVVDDLHWCDDASLRWLAYLSRRLEGLPVLVVLAHRTGERGMPAEVLETLREEARRLAPVELSADGTRTLLRTTGTEVRDAAAAACHQATRGNPLLVRELGRAAAGRRLEPQDVERLGAVAVADRVARRLRARSAPAVSLARAVAVLGPGRELRTAARLAQLDGPAAARAADELVDAALLQPGRPLAFEHPVVASAIAESLGEHERAALHLSAARVLEAEGSGAPRVAAHLLQAAPEGDPWVAERLLAAGEAALGEGATIEAGNLLGRALREPPPAERRGRALVLAGSAAWLQGDPDTATPLLRDAMVHARSEDDRFAAAAQLAQVLLWQNLAPEALEVLQDLAEHTADPSLRLELEAERAAAELAQGHDPVPVWRRLEALHADADRTLPGARLLAGALAYAVAVTGLRPASRTRELLQELVLGEELVARGISTLFLPALAGMAAAAADAPEIAEAIGAELRRRAVFRGSRVLELSSHGPTGYALFARGALHDAEAHYREALALAGDTGLRFIAVGMRTYLSRTLAERGAVDEALALIDPEIDPGMVGRTTLFSAMHVLATAGRWRRVVELGDQTAASVTGTEARFPSTPWRLPAIHAHIALGDPERAADLLREQRVVTDTWCSPRLSAATLRAEARLAGGDEAVDLLRHAVDEVSGTYAQLELARSLVALGEALRRGGHRVDCRAPLREGLDLADRCGAAPLAERAAEELRATGARPRKVLLRGAASLTASELRTCRLAAEGRTNREIAQELWVTRKTVETHLSRAFRKLDVRSRDELGAALDGDQPTPAAA